MKETLNNHQEYVHCNLCDKDDASLLFIGKDIFSGKKEQFRITRCNSCGLVYVNPRPTEEAIKDYYFEDYCAYHKFPLESIGIMGKAKGLWQQWKNSIKRIILEEYYGYNFGHRRHWLKKIIVFSFLAKFKKMYYRLIPYVPDGRVLDIGCGNTRDLALYKSLGWDAYGVEINRSCVDYAKNHYGINIFCGDLQEAGFPDAYFDCITMRHFLEHASDPSQILRETRRLIKDDGLAVIEVPNFSSLEVFLLKEKSILVDVPRHLYVFTTTTLKKLLEKNGFRIEKIDYLASYWSIESSINHHLGKKGVKFRIDTKWRMHLFVVIIDMIISWLRLSSIMVFYCRKSR